jgi:hypothetical protein
MLKAPGFKWIRASAQPVSHFSCHPVRYHCLAGEQIPDSNEKLRIKPPKIVPSMLAKIAVFKPRTTSSVDKDIEALGDY